MDRPMVATMSSVSLMSVIDWDIDRPGICAWSLNTMPQDLVCPILMPLTIADVVNLAATNVLTYVSYITEPVAGTTPLSCRGVVRAMRFARAKCYDRDATMLALTHITCQDVRMRPGLLAQLAYAVPGMAARPAGRMSPAWSSALLGTRKDWRLCFKTDMPAELSYLLEIADWQARFSTNPKTQQLANDAALDRMRGLPPALWPVLMQAFAARGMRVRSKVLLDFVDTFHGCLFSISDLFASELATVLYNDKKRTDIKNTLCRLGVSERQLSRVVMPALAESVARSIFAHGEPVISALPRWAGKDDAFSVHVHEAYLRRLFQYAKQHTAWSCVLQEHDMVGVLSTERRHRFIERIESDCIAVLQDGTKDRETFLGLIESMECSPDSHATWLATYQTLKNVLPLAIQAPLIHRWVRKLGYPRLDMRQVGEVLRDVGAWRLAFEEKLGRDVQPRLVARAYAAEMEAWMMLAEHDQEASRDRVREVSESVFTVLPPSAWGCILERLSAASIGYVRRRHVLEKIQSFLLDENATSAYPSDTFATSIAHSLNHLIWPELPDRAVAPLTKMDVFCARFDLRGKHREPIEWAISVDRLRTTSFRRE